MTSEQRTESYIASLDKGLPEYLDLLAKQAEEERVPIIRSSMRNLMRTLLTLHKPMDILEIGCAVGFSALLMREYTPEGARITTIENYEPRIAQAKENFSKWDTDNRITLIEGDAVEILKTMRTEGYTGPGFDLIFMDAAKGQYLNMYEDVKRLLRPGGMLLSDNVLQEGDILESRYAVSRRDRTIHARMREYLYQLCHDEDYETAILAVADGVSISVKTDK